MAIAETTKVIETPTEAVEPETGYTRAEQRHYQEIREQERIVGVLADQSTLAKERAKAAKSTYDEAAAELHAFIRRGPDLQQKLPGMEDVDQLADAWRDLPLSEAGIVDGLAKPLIEAGIDTLGKLADWSVDGKDLNDIDGIGTAKADKIGELMTQFWAAHPEFCEEPGESEEEEGENPCP